MTCTCIRSNVCELLCDNREKLNNALMVLSHLQLIANQAAYNRLDKEEALQRMCMILNASSK